LNRISSIADTNKFICSDDKGVVFLCPNREGNEPEFELRYSDEKFHPEEFSKYEYFYIKTNVNPRLVVAPSDTLNNNLNIESRDLVMKDVPED